MSDALILKSVNPQDCSWNCKKNASSEHVVSCVQIFFWMSKQKHNFCTQHVLYCNDARMRAYEKGLPVPNECLQL